MSNEVQKTERPRYEQFALAAKEMFTSVCDEKVWLREIAFAMQIIRGNKLIQDLANTPTGAQSIKNAIVNVAMCGTTLNPALAKAYLVPRKIHGQMMCCLDISYRGLAGIAMDSGSVKHLAPRIVYSFDHFEYWEEDGQPHVRHQPSLNPPEDFGNGTAKFWDYLVCGYMVATLHDDTKIILPPFPKWKLQKAMNTSMTTSDKTPWRTHPDEMALKTIIKHGYKLLPQTDRMSTAVAVLNEHEGIDKEQEKRDRKEDIMKRFADDPVDAEFSPVPEGVDPATGEVKEPCPECQQVEGHTASCPNAEPPADLFDDKKKK